MPQSVRNISDRHAEFTPTNDPKIQLVDSPQLLQRFSFCCWCSLPLGTADDPRLRSLRFAFTDTLRDRHRY